MAIEHGALPANVSNCWALYRSRIFCALGPNFAFVTKIHFLQFPFFLLPSRPEPDVCLSCLLHEHRFAQWLSQISSLVLCYPQNLAKSVRIARAFWGIYTSAVRVDTPIARDRAWFERVFGSQLLRFCWDFFHKSGNLEYKLKQYDADPL